MLECLEVLEELHKGSRIVTEEDNGKSPDDTLGGTLGEEAKVIDPLTVTTVGDFVSDCEGSMCHKKGKLFLWMTRNTCGSLKLSTKTSVL